MFHTPAHGSKERVRYQWWEQTSRSLKAALLLCRCSITSLCQSLPNPSFSALSPVLSIWHKRLVIVSCWARSRIPRASSVSPLASKRLYHCVALGRTIYDGSQQEVRTAFDMQPCLCNHNDFFPFALALIFLRSSSSTFHFSSGTVKHGMPR